ncbi:Protein artemis, partial [Araneus ventricosus]
YFSKIYVSEVSKHLLENSDSYCYLAKYLESIPLEQPKIIAIPNKDGEILSRVTVTLVAAGHCLGSVMIYIEGENGRILYTGDFRLPVGDAARLVNLHDEEGRLKPLDALYVDTTFCKEHYLYFPTREQGLEAVISLVGPWLAKGPDHIISLICSAKYNYEFVFVELFKKFHQKIHISEERLRQYRGIKIIEDAVTTVETESRIHACKKDKKNGETFYVIAAPCGYYTEDGKPIKVKYIKLCAMSFKHGAADGGKLQMYISKDKMHKVCFSTHSSLSEVRDLVSYLKPKIVYPNVVQGQTVEEILELINATPHQDLSSPELKFSISPLGDLRNMTPDDKCTTISSNSLPFYDEYYRIPVQNQTSCDQLARVYSANKKEEVIDSKKINGMSFQMKSDTLDLADSSSTAIKSKVVDEENEAIINSGNAEKTSEVSLHNESDKCELLNAVDNSSAAVKSKSCDTSPLKWKFPSLSSDDENCDPNSSYDSSKDKSESETTYATSEEQDLKVPDLDCDFKIPNSVSTKIATPNNGSSRCQYAEETNQFFRKGFTEKNAHSNNTTSITYFVHNIINSPDKDFDVYAKKLMSGTDSAVIKEIRDDVVNSEDCSKTINYRFINKNDVNSQEEMRFVKSAGEISGNDSCPVSKNILLRKASTMDSENFSVGCQKSGSCRNQENSTECKMQTSQDIQPWQCNKLPIEISDDENLDSSTDLEVVFTQISKKSSNLNNSRHKNFVKGNISSDNISNFSNSSKLDLVKGQMTKAPSFNENSIFSKKTLSTGNVGQNLNHFNEQIDKSHNENVEYASSKSKSFSGKSDSTGRYQNDLRTKGNSISSQSSQNFFIRKISQDLGSNLNEEENRFVRKLLPDLSSRMFSHKLPDISASKYERNHTKLKSNKTSNTIYTLSKSSNRSQNSHKGIELVDLLSSDDSVESSPPKFLKPKHDTFSMNSKLISKNSKMSSNQNISNWDIVDSSSDVEVLDDSPSLLVPTYTKKNSNDLFLSSGGTKRKCTESSDVPAQKSPKLEEENSPDIFDGDYDSESTPEDILLTTNYNAILHLNRNSGEM